MVRSMHDLYCLHCYQLLFQSDLQVDLSDLVVGGFSPAVHLGIACIHLLVAQGPHDFCIAVLDPVEIADDKHA